LPHEKGKRRLIRSLAQNRAFFSISSSGEEGKGQKSRDNKGRGNREKMKGRGKRLSNFHSTRWKKMILILAIEKEEKGPRWQPPPESILIEVKKKEKKGNVVIPLFVKKRRQSYIFARGRGGREWQKRQDRDTQPKKKGKKGSKRV